MKEKTLVLKTVYWSKRDVEALQLDAKERGISFSELVRRIVSFYISEKANKKERLSP